MSSLCASRRRSVWSGALVSFLGLLSVHVRWEVFGVRPFRHYPPHALPTDRLRPCRWPAARRLRPAEVNTTVAAILDQFLAFLEDEVRGRLMYEYTLRDGSLLGALRNGGLIPGDRDLDAVVLLPENDSLAGFRSACDRRLEALGRPFDLQEVGSPTGVAAGWVTLRPWVQPSGYPPVVADVAVYPSSILGLAGSVDSVGKAAHVFSSLCRCSFSGREASCFHHAPQFLSSVYGDWSVPSLRHSTAVGIFDVWPGVLDSVRRRDRRRPPA